MNTSRYTYVIHGLVGIVLCAILVTPLYPAAAWRIGEPIVPCRGVVLQGETTTDQRPACDFNSLIKLINNLIDVAIYLLVPILALTMAYAGFMYLSAAGNSSKAAEARRIFRYTLWGLVWFFGAWLIVKTLATALLDEASEINTYLN